MDKTRTINKKKKMKNASRVNSELLTDNDNVDEKLKDKEVNRLVVHET